jgi:hypothetical protein
MLSWKECKEINVGLDFGGVEIELPKLYWWKNFPYTKSVFWF